MKNISNQPPHPSPEDGGRDGPETLGFYPQVTQLVVQEEFTAGKAINSTATTLQCHKCNEIQSEIRLTAWSRVIPEKHTSHSASEETPYP
jgi:hypothetical protein